MLKQQDIDNAFERLTSNAFYFLNDAIEQFEENPKNAVIFFSTSIELILKARLLREHWTLVFKEKPVASKFKEHNFHTHNRQNLMGLIKDVCEEHIKEDAIKSFNELAKHRNKIIHYYHKEKHDEFKAEIVKDFFSCWVYLKKLLEELWYECFSDYQDEINSFESKMKKIKQYLKHIYDGKKSDIQAMADNGVNVINCTSCGHHASVENKNFEIISYICHVCDHKEDDIYMAGCIHCKEPRAVTFSGQEEDIFCKKCKKEYSSEDIEKLFRNLNYRFHQEINCDYCGGLNTGVDLQNGYAVCKECYNVTDRIAYCDWCNTLTMGINDLRASSIIGCSFCAGSSSYD